MSSAYDLDLAIDSTCPVSMSRQRKQKFGKPKKQASAEEMTMTEEETDMISER